MASIRSRDFRATQWQDWANLVLAVWLFISPWVLGFAIAGQPNATHTTTAAWNAWIVAIIIAVISIAALARAQRWEEWINLLAGIWLFISPWLLNYSGTRNALWDAVIIGAVVVILAAWDLIAMQRTVHHHA